MTSDDTLDPVALWQCLCKVHGRFRLYTDFLLPRKHYVMAVVEAALESRASGTPLDDFCSTWYLHDRSTPARWIAAFRNRLETVTELVQRLLKRFLSAAPGRGDPSGSSLVRTDYASAWEALGLVCAAYAANGMDLPSRSHLALFA